MMKPNELKTVRVEKDTWILELPEEIYLHEVFVEIARNRKRFKRNVISR